MAINFPNSPSPADFFQDASYSPTYRYIGNRWRAGRGASIVQRGNSQQDIVSLDIALPAGYRGFELMLKGFEPFGGTSYPALRVSQDGGAGYISSAGTYQYVGDYAMSGNQGYWSHSSTGVDSLIQLAHSICNATTTLSFTNLLIDPGSPSYAASINWSSLYVATDMVQSEGLGNVIATGRITNIRLYFTTRNVNVRSWELIGFTGAETPEPDIALPSLRYNKIMNARLVTLIDEI